MSLTNVALNSRSLNGIITISDGVAVISEGNIDCEDINSANINTDNINTNLLNVTGKLECNSAGPYNIPTSISSVTGLLIGYGHTTNSGATDFLNFGSTYTSTQQGFRFWNKSNTQTLTNLAIIDNTQTYFKSQLTGCTAETPLNTTSIVNKTYVDSNFVYKTGSVTENIDGLKTFIDNTIFDGTARFNDRIDFYNGVNTSSINQSGFDLYIKNLVQAGSIYLQTNAVIGGTQNSFKINYLSCDILSPTLNFNSTDTINILAPTNLIGRIINLFTNLSTNIINLGSQTSTTNLKGNIISNGEVTFNNICPISNTNASLTNHLTTLGFNNGKYIDFITDQTITGTKRLSNFFCTALNITPTSGGIGNRQQIYMTGTELAFVPQFNSNTYSFYCKDSVPTQTTPLIINSVSTTISNLLVSNNLTSPSITGTNNIYTNLSLDGGIINVGARGSNINIKCSLNIVESVYGTTPNKITTINQEGDSCRFTNNGSSNGDFIFEINESGTYNPLVINKTSVNIAGDSVVGGNLILYDTTPSTKNVIIGMVGNDLFFTPSINTPSSTYNFKVSDSASTITTPLTINSANTTINNSLSGQRASFRTPTVNQDSLILYGTGAVDNRIVFIPYSDGFMGYQNIFQNKDSGILFFSEQAINRGAFCIAPWNSGSAGIRISIANVSIPGPLVTGGNATFSSSLISNNLTAPTTTSTNNIYTSLVGGGIINMGGSLGVNNIYGQTFFNSASIFNLGCSFLGLLTFNNGGTFSEIEQTSGSNLVIRNITNSRDIILSTKSASTGQVDSLKINTTSCDILSPTLNLNSASTINILSPNNLTGTINFLSTLTTATINFCSTAYTSIFNLNARLAHKQVQYMNEVKIISGTSATLTFPLEQRWQFTSTGATQIVINLPQLTASHQAGFYFTLFKTASNTNSIKIDRQGTNVIRGYNSITDLTTNTILSGSGSSVSIITAEISTGVFAWIVTA